MVSWQVGIEMSWGDDGVRRYCVPRERAAAMREMGALFQNLLLRDCCADDSLSMVKTRSQAMMNLNELPRSQGAAA